MQLPSRPDELNSCILRISSCKKSPKLAASSSCRTVGTRAPNHPLEYSMQKTRLLTKLIKQRRPARFEYLHADNQSRKFPCRVTNHQIHCLRPANFPGTPSCSPSCHASPSPPMAGFVVQRVTLCFSHPAFRSAFPGSWTCIWDFALAHFRLQGFSGLPLLTAFLVCFLPPTLQGCSSCVLLVCPSPDPASPKAQGVACKAVLQDILMLRCRRS